MQNSHVRVGFANMPANSADFEIRFKRHLWSFGRTAFHVLPVRRAILSFHISFPLFLAALAALYLPWLVTDSLSDGAGFRAFQAKPDQTYMTYQHDLPS